MKRPLGLFALLILAAVQAACRAEPPAAAPAGDIRVEAPWVRPTPPGAAVTGVFLRLRNAGARSDRLLSVDSPEAGRVELHESRMEGGMARMRPLPDGVEIPAGGQVELKPGGHHLMLFDLRRPLKNGDSVTLRLHFEGAGPVQLTAPVQVGATGSAGEGHEGHH